MHNFLVIETAWVPEWTRLNIPTYPLARFNNDRTALLVDNAHPISTFYAWLGPTPNADEVLQFILRECGVITDDQLRELEMDPNSAWFQPAPLEGAE